MADLIDRSETTSEMLKHAKGTTVIGGQTFRTIKLEDALDAIAALPAQGVRVRPLEWIDFEGRGAKAQAWNEANYMIQRWSDGRYEINASYPGYCTDLEGMDCFYPTLDAAKAAAQADYERRILSALAPAEAGGLEGHPYSLRPDLQRIVENAKTVPQWDTERDRMAPAPVDALVKAAGDALDDLDEWVGCAESLTKAGFNTDDTAERAERLRAALAAYRGGAR